MIETLKTKIILAAVFVCMISFSASAQGLIEITSIEVSSSGAYGYVNIKTTGWASPYTRYSESSYKLTLTFYDAYVKTPINIGRLSAVSIESISVRGLGGDPASSEVVIMFGRPFKYDVGSLIGRNITAVEFSGVPPVDMISAPMTFEQPSTTNVTDKPREIKAEVITKPISELESSLPDLSRQKKLKVILNGNEFKVARGEQLFSGSTLMVPADDFFEALDAQVIVKNKDTLLVRRGDQFKAELRSNSMVATVNGKDFELLSSVKRGYKIGRAIFYLPMLSAAEMVGYEARFSKKDNALVIDPALLKIDISTNDGATKLDLVFSDSVERERVTLSSSGSLITIEAKDVLLSEKFTALDLVNRGGIDKVFVSSDDPRKLVITLNLKAPKAYRQYFSEKEDVHTVLLCTAIKSIKSTSGDGSTRIDMLSDGELTFEVSSIGSPEKIVFDFPNTILTASSVINVSDKFVLSAKASQFTIDPPKARIVVALSDHMKFSAALSEDKKAASLTLFWPKGKPKIVLKATEPKTYSVLRNKVIIIDPGHGGRDPGTIGYSGSYEKNAALLLALRIADALEKAGATVLLTRDKDINLGLSDVVRFANSNKADIFIAVHYNSFMSSYSSGAETYYYTPQSRLLARLVHRSVLRGTKRRDRGIKRVMYYTIHHTKMPSMLIEPGYLTNPAEEKLAFNPAFRNKVSFAILRGVVEYFSAMKKMRR